MTTRTKLTICLISICLGVSATLLLGQSTYVTGATGTFITNAATRLRMTATNLLGRTSAGSGPIQEIAIGSGLVMTNQTLAATGGAGGTTINATDGVIPVRGSATTFTNSPLYVGSNDSLWFGSEDTLPDMLVFDINRIVDFATAPRPTGFRFYGTNGAAITDFYLDVSDGSISQSSTSDNGSGSTSSYVNTSGTSSYLRDFAGNHSSGRTATINEDVNQAASPVVGTYNMSLNSGSGTTASYDLDLSAANAPSTLYLVNEVSGGPGESGIKLRLQGTDYSDIRTVYAGTDGSRIYQDLNRSRLVMQSANDTTYNATLDVVDTGSYFKLVSGGNTNFYAASASGYTGGGTNVLLDNGTYGRPSGLTPGGAAGGSLVGTYPNPTLAGGVTAGTYRSVTVQTNGLVSSGTNPTTFSGYGISDTSANLASALTDETGGGIAVFNAGPTFTTNIVITGGVVTSSIPALNISQTWSNASTAFSAVLVNVSDTSNTNSSSTAKIIDVQTNSVSAMYVDKFGAVGISKGSTTKPGLHFSSETNTGLYSAASSQLGFVSAGTEQARLIGSLFTVNTLAFTVGTSNPTLTRDSTDTIQMGSDAASVTSPQTFKAADGSGANTNGAAIRFQGGQGTGTGRGGAIIFQTSVSTNSSSVAGRYMTRGYTEALKTTLTESSATLFANIGVLTNTFMTAIVHATVNADDGSNFQALASTLNVSAVNTNGTVTTQITQVDGTTAASSGTLTCTYTAVANGNGVDLKANAVSSLTQTTLDCRWDIISMNGNGTGVVTPQ